MKDRLQQAIEAANKAKPGGTRIDALYVEGRTWHRQPDGDFEPEFYETDFFKALAQAAQERTP